MKFFRLLMPALLAFAVVSCYNDDIKPLDYMADGDWEGVGEGRSGVILVRSTVKDRVITNIKVVSSSESVFTSTAIQTIISTALSKQDYLSLEVDGVTGATLTSTGMIDAINNSIDASKGISHDERVYKDCECDVVVVGAGGAGLSAAIAAAERGCKVIVLEKEGIIGGNTNYSTGGINAAETSSQAELGIVDSKQTFYDDTFNGGHGLGDPKLIWSFVDHAPETVDWLKGFGADLSDVGLMGGSSVKRTHRPKGGAAIGPHLMKVLRTTSSSKEIDIRTRNKVVGLLSDKGRVTGVTVETGGRAYTITAKAVIIATGGFGGNLSMVSKYKPELTGFSTLNHKGATGDAFEWVTKAGGDLVQMEQIQIHPTAEAKSHIMITEAVRGNGAILLNSSGARFVNEMSTRDIVSAAILAQNGGTAWLVFDSQVRSSLSSIETYANQGILLEASTLSDLASKLGVNEKLLTDNINRYNTFQSDGRDTDFGRSATEMPVPLDVPPYYAVEVTPAIHHTMGGLHVDSSLHVLKADGSAIPGLFAAGEVTGGLHGANRLGGNGVADVVVNGRLAGLSASSFSFSLSSAASSLTP